MDTNHATHEPPQRQPILDRDDYDPERGLSPTEVQMLEYDGASAGLGTAAPDNNGDMPHIRRPIVGVAKNLDRTTALALVGTMNQRNGRLYASRPRKATGDTVYLWRILAFHLSPKPEHQCMPVTADMDVGPDHKPGDTAENTRKRFQARDVRVKVLSGIVKRVIDLIPPNQWHGARRWHRALHG